MRMQAPFGDASLFLLADIVDAEPGERPSESLANHDGAQILARRSADGDDAAEAVAVLLLADDRAACSQCLKPGRCQASGGPSVRANLLDLRSVDAPQAIGDAALLERVAVGDGLGEARRCNGESHRDQRKPAEQRQSSPQVAWLGFRCLRPPNTLAWLAAPMALTISKMRLRTRPSRIL
jgi:hypothetical protein